MTEVGILRGELAAATTKHECGSSNLWYRAHTICDGNRDAMWEWLEVKYAGAVQELLADMEARIDCRRRWPS